MDRLKELLETRLEQANHAYEKLILNRCLSKLQEIDDELDMLDNNKENWDERYESEISCARRSNELMTTFLPYMLLYNIRQQDEL